MITAPAKRFSVVAGCLLAATGLLVLLPSGEHPQAQTRLEPRYDPRGTDPRYDPRYIDPRTAREYEPERPPLSPRERRCLELEQQLVLETRRRDQGKLMLPELYKQQRKLERQYQRARAKAERRNCYEYFLFSRTLRRTRRCLALNRDIETLRGRLADLHEQITAIRSARTNSYRRQRLIEALARYGCGEVYRRSARRSRARSWNLFESIFGDRGGFSNDGYYDNAPADVEPETGIVAGATYRTMCVRLCDGYYFPISFSTIPSKFNKDRQLCRSKCAAPTELFVYRNPGGQIEQMISLDGAPYAKIENAFRYRKEFVKGCSCKPDEYDPEAIYAANNPDEAQDETKAGRQGQGQAAVQGAQGEAEEAQTAGRSKSTKPRKPKTSPNQGPIPAPKIASEPEAEGTSKVQ